MAASFDLSAILSKIRNPVENQKSILAVVPVEGTEVRSEVVQPGASFRQNSQLLNDFYLALFRAIQYNPYINLGYSLG